MLVPKCIRQQIHCKAQFLDCTCHIRRTSQMMLVDVSFIHASYDESLGDHLYVVVAFYHHFALLGADLNAICPWSLDNLVGRFLEFIDASPSISMSSANLRLQMSPPPLKTNVWWSWGASLMMLSRYMLKRTGDSKHPWPTITVVWNNPTGCSLKITTLLRCSSHLHNSLMLKSRNTHQGS